MNSTYLLEMDYISVIDTLTVLISLLNTFMVGHMYKRQSNCTSKIGETTFEFNSSYEKRSEDP